MPFDNYSDVWHTTVAQLQGVPVEYFVQLRVLREVLAYQRLKPSADVGGYIAAVGWVEPSDVPLTVSPCLSSLLSTCHVFKLLIIAAPLKRIIVQRTSIGENSNVTGDIRESPANGRRQVFDDARWVVGLPVHVQWFPVWTELSSGQV